MEQARWQSERLLAGWKYGTSIRPEVRVIVALRDGENFETWLSVPAALRLGLARAAVTHFFSFACVLGIATAALSADNKPFTPPADLKGKWDFRADPKLPNVLIIGDSISIAYTRAVRERLHGKANVYRPMRGQATVNCGDTRMSLPKIDEWLAPRKWDVIHFNWGLWDLCYRNPLAKTQGNRDKVNGTLAVSPEEYARNLETLVSRLAATGARLIWASTTFVPEEEAGRFVGDDVTYNAVAARVMKKHGVANNDLFALTKGFAGKYLTKKGDVHFTPESSAVIGAQVAAAIEKTLPR